MSLGGASMMGFDGAARLTTTKGQMRMTKTVSILVARLIFGAVFLKAATFKFLGMDSTATYIAAAGFPIPLVLAWLAAFFEVALVVAFLSGAFFYYASCLAAAYVLFLGFAFHGPSHWSGNQAEFGFFVDHFTFFAGLLYAAVHGPGDKWVWRIPRKADRLAPARG
jgi:putative oxidoreductase